jgi:phosphoribosylformimino-5-aminoimidazole carboxamide ribonucleotide (ProFAR) isomerase
VVDLDAARDGSDANLDVIRAIATAVPQCRIQTGGGVRDRDAARRRLEAGAARVVIGSAALSDPQLVHDLAAAYTERVVVGLDVRGRTIATHGWTRSSGVDLDEAIFGLPPGLAAVVVTQIDVDGMLSGPDIGLYSELLAVSAVPVIASGGIGSPADLRALASLESAGRRLIGAIAGKAIYEGRFGVEEGIAACSPSV